MEYGNPAQDTEGERDLQETERPQSKAPPGRQNPSRAPEHPHRVWVWAVVALWRQRPKRKLQIPPQVELRTGTGLVMVAKQRS